MLRFLLILCIPIVFAQFNIRQLLGLRQLPQANIQKFIALRQLPKRKLYEINFIVNYINTNSKGESQALV